VYVGYGSGLRCDGIAGVFYGNHYLMDILYGGQVFSFLSIALTVPDHDELSFHKPLCGVRTIRAGTLIVPG